MPSTVLLEQCNIPDEVELLTTRDIVISRYNWKQAYCECAFKNNALRKWYNLETKDILICREL